MLCLQAKIVVHTYIPHELVSPPNPTKRTRNCTIEERETQMYQTFTMGLG